MEIHSAILIKRADRRNSFIYPADGRKEARVTNKYARRINRIATFYMVLGILAGLFAAASTILSGNFAYVADSRIQLNQTGTIVTGVVLMLIIWLAVFIQVAFIQGFAELIEQTSLTRAGVEQVLLKQRTASSSDQVPPPFYSN